MGFSSDLVVVSFISKKSFSALSIMAMGNLLLVKSYLILPTLS